MGRDAGWLTAASALARNDYNTAPHFIYLPEVAFDKEQFLTDIRNKLKTLNNVIVAVSEESVTKTETTSQLPKQWLTSSDTSSSPEPEKHLNFWSRKTSASKSVP